MKVSSKKRIFLICLLAMFTVMWTLIIFAQSAKNGEESTKDTNMVMEIIEEVADVIGVDADVSTRFVRKTAHFGEYMILGILASFLMVEAGGGWRFAVAFCYAVSVAFCDEFAVQRLSEGRAPQLTDVLIDASGALVGVLLVFAISCIIISKNNSKKARKDEI